MGEVRLAGAYIDWYARIGRLRRATREAVRDHKTHRAALNRLRTSTRNYNRTARSTLSTFGSLRGAAALLAGSAGLGLLLRRWVQIGDELLRLQALLRIVTRSEQNLLRIQGQLVEIAQQTRSSLSATITLYTRLARSTAGFAISQVRLLNVTRAVNQALQIAGATAAEASSGVVQFGQGLASSRLSGDEMRSVLEQMPRLARALAAGLGIGIGALREFGQAGVLTTDVVLPALESQVRTLNEEFAQIPRTVSGAVTQVRNDLLVAIGTVTQTSGASRELLRVLDQLRAVIRTTGFRAFAFDAARFATVALRLLIENAREVVKVLSIIVGIQILSRFRLLELLVIDITLAYIRLGKVGAVIEFLQAARIVALLNLRLVQHGVILRVLTGQMTLATAATRVWGLSLVVLRGVVATVVGTVVALTRALVALAAKFALLLAGIFIIEAFVRSIIGLTQGLSVLEALDKGFRDTADSYAALLGLGTDVDEDFFKLADIEFPEVDALDVAAMRARSDAIQENRTFLRELNDEQLRSIRLLSQSLDLLGKDRIETARLTAAHTILNKHYERQRELLNNLADAQDRVINARAAFAQQPLPTLEEVALPGDSPGQATLRHLEQIEAITRARAAAVAELEKGTAIARDQLDSHERTLAVTQLFAGLVADNAEALERARIEAERIAAATESARDSALAYATALANGLRANRDFFQQFRDSNEASSRTVAQQLQLLQVVGEERDRLAAQFDVENQAYEFRLQLQQRINAAAAEHAAALRMVGATAFATASDQQEALAKQRKALQELLALREVERLFGAQIASQLTDIIKLSQEAASENFELVRAQDEVQKRLELWRQIYQQLGYAASQFFRSMIRGVDSLSDAVDRLVEVLLDLLLQLTVVRAIQGLNFNPETAAITAAAGGGGGGGQVVPFNFFGGATGFTPPGGVSAVTQPSATRSTRLASGGAPMVVNFAPVINTNDSAEVRRVLYEEAFPEFSRYIEDQMDQRLSRPGRTRRAARRGAA